MPIKTVLIVHNRYLQPGGEDSVASTEARLLRSRGLRVIEYIDTNQRLLDLSALSQAFNFLWSRTNAARMRALIREHRPDIVHLHNIHFAHSPAVANICIRARVPIVQTLHNYRLLCINGRLIRNCICCEKCRGSLGGLHGIWHKCFQSSMAKSAAITIIRQIHRGFLGWGINIDTYIALSQFAKSLHIASGYPADRIVVKPNCAPMDSGPGDGSGGYCLFVGRLEPDKGINLLIEAVKYLPANVRIKIAGDGVERDAVRETARSHPNVEWCGHKSGAEINELMRHAALLVFPSLAYENFPVVIAEAYSVGLPVLASRRGAMIELVDDGVTGRFFSPVDPQDLALQIQSLLNDRDGLEGMRHHARREYEQKYSPARNVDLLLNIYASTIDRARMRWTAGTSGNHCPESTIQAAS